MTATRLGPRLQVVRAKDVRDGDVLYLGEDNGTSLEIGKVEALCVPGEATTYRVCDRYDSRIGHWFDGYDNVLVLRSPHQHTTERCL